MALPALKEKPRAYLVYIHNCRECGVQIETRRPPGDKPTDAQHCKRCKWRLRARRYNARYPERTRAVKVQWANAHRDKVREHNRASRLRNIEKNRARNREYCRTHPKSGPRHPFEQELAKQIRQLAII